MSSDTATYFQTRDVLLYLTAPILIIGGLNWLATGIQNIRKGDAATKSDDLLNALQLPQFVINIIYVLVGIAAIGMLAYMFMFTFGAPSILDQTFFPSTLTVPERSVDAADAAVNVQTQPFSKVAFWAAKPPLTPGAVYDDANIAYGNFENAGMAIADANGNAVLRFRRPGAYMVRGRQEEPHVHYRTAPSLARVADGFDAQTWSPVQTAYDFQSFARSE